VDAEKNKAVVRRYLEEVWVKGNTGAVEQLLAPNYTLRVVQSHPGHLDAFVEQAHGLDDSIARYRRAFPDLRIEPDTIVAEGDWVAVQWTASGTHTGEFRGIAPTGKRVTYAAVSFYRLSDGKIAEERYLGDRLGLWQQLGIVAGSRQLVEEARQHT